MNKISAFFFGSTAYKSYIAVTDRFVYSGTNFLTMVIVGRACGLDGLGIFALAWTVLLATNVIQEAFVLSPFTVFAEKRSRDKDRRAYASAAISLHMTIAAFALILVLVAVAVLALAIDDPVIQGTAWALSIVIPCVSMREFARRFMFAEFNAAGVLILDVLTAGIQFAGIAIFWSTGWLMPGSALMLIALATGGPALMWMAAHRTRFARIDRPGIAAEARRHWAFGRWVCAGQLSDLAVTHGVAWLIAAMAGTVATGVFAAGNSIVMVVNPILLGVGSVLLPRTAEANHARGLCEVGRIVWKTTAVLAVSVGALSLLVGLNGEALVRFFYSTQSFEGVNELIILLVIANFIGAAAFAVDNGLLAVKRPDVNLSASMVGLAVTFLVAIALTPALGVIGTAWGVLIGTACNSIIQIAAFSRLVAGPLQFIGWPVARGTEDARSRGG